MSFLRNMARVLRDEDGAFNRDSMGFAFGATLLALGGLTLALTGSLGLTLAALVLGVPLQLMGMAYRPTAPIVAGAGSILVGGAATVAAAFVIGFFLPWGLGWSRWLFGGAIGFLCARTTRRRFKEAIQKLDKPGWY
ncbi:MAG TPA: hypothetical protein VNA24_02945 [Hyalangium sp.]|nr:hypothetical protein [Hyalangium sp.]